MQQKIAGTDDEMYSTFEKCTEILFPYVTLIFPPNECLQFSWVIELPF